MSNVIQNVINSVLDDGARPAKFRLYINNSDSDTMNSVDVLCKSSSFPGRELEAIDVKYKGRSILIPGQPKYTQTWDLTFYLEEDHKTRIFFDNWIEGFNAVTYHEYESSKTHQTTLEVTQLNFEMDKEVAKYTLYNAYPTNISDITLSSDEVGVISEYNVTFTFTHYEVRSGDGTLNANEIADKLLGDVQNAVTSTIQDAKNKLEDSLTSVGNDIVKSVKDAFSIDDYLL